jgi:3',5'-cyclic AMP phosphodiesterase CpdA
VRKQNSKKQLGCCIAVLVFLVFSAEATASAELFTVGAVADVQYADREPRGGRTPRQSPRRLRKAVDSFNAREVDFAISLGDLIDWDDIDYSKLPADIEVVHPVDWTHFETIDAIWRQIRAPRHYVLGNHEWCVPDRADDGEKPGRVLRRFGFEDQAYYDFSHQGFRFILLDGTDRYMYAYAKGSEKFRDAQAYLQGVGASPRNRWWNGAISQTQLDWLRETLVDAARQKEKVVVCCHFPVHDPEEAHSLLNAQDVCDVLDAFPNVVLWLNGHNHAGGYAVMNEGMPNRRHHLNLKGMQNGDDRYYRLLFYADRVDVFRAEQETPERTMTFESEKDTNEQD